MIDYVNDASSYDHQLQWTASPTPGVTGYRLCTDVASYCLNLSPEITSYTFPNLCHDVDVIFTVATQSTIGLSMAVEINYIYMCPIVPGIKYPTINAEITIIIFMTMVTALAQDYYIINTGGVFVIICRISTSFNHCVL